MTKRRGEGGRYPVGIVGESHYQPAIRKTVVGEAVQLMPEPDNPFDKHAVAVRNAAGKVIGYLERDHWLKKLILDERKPIIATVKSIEGPRGRLGVVLNVSTGAAIADHDDAFDDDDVEASTGQKTKSVLQGCWSVIGAIAIIWIVAEVIF